MAAVESSSLPESPYDDGDAVYPCKGCGEILEEGKAFELAGNRWHIDCFRCNTCGTLLDSDANLLLLGDGSLICNNCTYSCNACGNKIEDLAILTGDQAFCAACFRCRNCKRKIENLRYARTSQGIFCMTCHESLMARRRKKSKKSGTPTSGTSTAPVVLDKSLPALPPSAVPQATLDTPDTESSTERVPRVDNSRLRGDQYETVKREPSPLSADSRKDTATLPASTYKQRRKSSMSSNEDNDDESRGFLPMAFDPSPVQGYPAATMKGMESVKARETHPRDYFNKIENRNGRDRASRSRDRTPERDASQGAPKPSSPHISNQDKSRSSFMKNNTSGQSTPMSGSAVASPATATAIDKAGERPKMPQQPTTSFTLGTGEGFKLQDAPKSRKNSVRKQSEQRSSDNLFQTSAQQSHPQTRDISKSIGTPDSNYNPFDDPKLRDNSGLTRHPARGDSLASSARKPVPSAQDRSETDGHASTNHGHTRSGSSASIPSQFVDAPSHPVRANGNVDSPSRPHLEIPPRAAGRSAPSKSVANDDFIAPRAPPVPPPGGHDRLRNESVTSIEGGGVEGMSPRRGHFKKPSLGGDFNMDDEMSRIMSGQRKDSSAEAASPSAGSMLRRVSNAVRHGRSFSDRAVPVTARTPTGSQLEISSPTLIPSGPASPSVREDVAALRVQLRRSQQKIAELESDKIALEEKVNSSSDIKQVNTELREKRSTMAFLDTQREMVVRELEVMTDHLTKAKDSNQPLDIASLKSDVLQDFAHSLQKLKDNLGSQIEDLVHKRNELTDDISNLIQVKDKGLQEFESLSSKNNQLNELNAQLVHSIQDMYKANRIPNGNTHLLNGLGISSSNKSLEPSSAISDPRSGSFSATTIDSPSTTLADTPEVEHAHMLNPPQPQVVNIRKGRFNWKRVGKDVAKTTTKGLKGAFARDENGHAISGPQPIHIGPPQSEASSLKGSTNSDRSLPFFAGGPGSAQKPGPGSNLKPGQLGASHKNSSSNNLGIVANDPSSLFGSDLTARCDYEKRVLPAVVTRCIEEVEARGMTQEGVYRKSGGSGQVKTIQMGFEKEGGSFDISDPDLDIHAVTSCLKQYFRKLPNPLITFEVYDGMLDAVSGPAGAGGVDENEKIAGLRRAVAQLPACHRDTLEFLMGHLGRVVEKEALNLMTPLNVSVVFAPTIMRPLSIEREMTDMQAQREVVRALLDHRAAVFE